MVEHRSPEGDQFLFVRSNGREIEVEFVDPNAEPARRPTAPCSTRLYMSSPRSRRPASGAAPRIGEPS
jgi:hypothetical protein